MYRTYAQYYGYTLLLETVNKLYILNSNCVVFGIDYVINDVGVRIKYKFILYYM